MDTGIRHRHWCGKDKKEETTKFVVMYIGKHRDDL